MGNVVVEALHVPHLRLHLECSQMIDSPSLQGGVGGVASRVKCDGWAGPQASVRVSAAAGSSAGSCCTSGSLMPWWSFSRDCFIWWERACMRACVHGETDTKAEVRNT